MTRPVLALLGLFMITPVFAQTLPTLDINRYCLQKAKISRGQIDDFYATCVAAETATQVELRDDWNDYSKESRQRCLKTNGDGGYYSDLQACIEAAEALRNTEGR